MCLALSPWCGMMYSVTLWKEMVHETCIVYISFTTVRAVIIQKSCGKRSRRQDTSIRKSTTHLDGLLNKLLTWGSLLYIVVFDNVYIYISFDPKSYMSAIWINFRKSLGLSLGFAMTLVMDTMVLRLVLGSSHGCGLGLRSLDLMVLLGCDLFHDHLNNT